MCFHFTDNIPHEAYIAEEDITCYKVLLHHEGNLWGPFRRNYSYGKDPEEGTQYTLDVNLEYRSVSAHDMGDKTFFVYVVEKGFHSFIKHGSCFRMIKQLSLDAFNGFPVYYYKMAEFIIPKGTKYFRNDAEYVSDKLQFVKLLQ